MIITNSKAKKKGAHFEHLNYHSLSILIVVYHDLFSDIEKLKFRFNSIVSSRGYKYVLMNIPTALVDQAVQIVPAMRSPTILPLAAEGWCSMHVVIAEDVLWEKVERLKELGAEGILVLNLENMIP